MAPRPIHLLIDNQTSKSRGHFSIFIPNASKPQHTTNQPTSPSNTPSSAGTVGTAIHVVGNPLTGFHHEFKRNFNTRDSLSLTATVLLGHVDPPDTTTKFSTDTTPLGGLDAAALDILCPGKSDVRAPVDGVVNKRCQEWTLEYVQHLVELGYLDASAIQLVQEQRDPPTHGVMLRQGGSD